MDKWNGRQKLGGFQDDARKIVNASYYQWSSFVKIRNSFPVVQTSTKFDR